MFSSHRMPQYLKLLLCFGNNKSVLEYFSNSRMLNFVTIVAKVAVFIFQKLLTSMLMYCFYEILYITLTVTQTTTTISISVIKAAILVPSTSSIKHNAVTFTNITWTPLPQATNVSHC